MGIYYRGISVRHLRAGEDDILYTNFWGKAPGIFTENTGRWDAFLTRSGKAADKLAGPGWCPSYVAMCNDGAELRKYGEACVAVYNGQATMDDQFWDNNTVGTVKKVEGRWKLVIDQDLVAKRDARIAAREARFAA